MEYTLGSKLIFQKLFRMSMKLLENFKSWSVIHYELL